MSVSALLHPIVHRVLAILSSTGSMASTSTKHMFQCPITENSPLVHVTPLISGYWTQVIILG